MKSIRTDLVQRLIARARRNPRGQSFVELMLVVLILALMLAGVVEFGFLINNFLHVLDGAREAARYSSTNLAFIMNGDGSINFPYNPPFYYQAAAKASDVMYPVVLDPENPDDIVISVFSVSGGTIVRFPPGNANGWSLCAHYDGNTQDAARGFGGFASYFPSLIPAQSVPTHLSNPAWSSDCTVRNSLLSNADVLARMDATAPYSGVLLVEVFYNYPQLLKLPVLTSVVADPMPLYVYTVMPLSNAEPTQVP